VAIEPFLPAAVFFDMDGTLVNTEHYWIEAELELSARDGGGWTNDDGYTVIGFDLTHTAQQLRARGGVKGTDEEIVADLVRIVGNKIQTQGLIWRPGAEELLKAVKAAGIRTALVTMSYISLAEIVIGQLPEGTFDGVITGDIVTHGKPHPEPYLKAAELLNVDPKQSVAIEDSVTGVKSAEAAGMNVLGVKFMVDIPAAPGRSRMTSLEEANVEILREIASGIVIDTRA
jgi:HAD superfamily hydrolase (TIGR01509 family)